MDADAYVAILRCSTCIYDTLFIPFSRPFVCLCDFWLPSMIYAALPFYGFESVLVHTRNCTLFIVHKWLSRGLSYSLLDILSTEAKVSPLTPSLLLPLSTPSPRLSDISTRPPTCLCTHRSDSASVSASSPNRHCRAAQVPVSFRSVVTHGSSVLTLSEPESAIRGCKVISIHEFEDSGAGGNESPNP